MKKLFIFTPIFLSLIIISSVLSPCVKMSENISNNVFRLHILANSDSECDQELKLKVRDEILKVSQSVYRNCKSVKDAVDAANNNIPLLQESALKIIKRNGYNYGVNVYTTRESFETRHYDGFTLPAGIYDSLKIEIGQGKGHNWWCVMFPSVCISGCVDDFDETLTEKEKEMIKSDKYVIRFKAVEIYERLKNRL